MKKNKYILLTLILIFCVSSNAQTPDLILQEDIDITYVSYLINKEIDWLDQVAVGGDDEPTMKAHMGLAIVHSDLIEKLPSITETPGLEYKITNLIK